MCHDDGRKLSSYLELSVSWVKCDWRESKKMTSLLCFVQIFHILQYCAQLHYAADCDVIILRWVKVNYLLLYPITTVLKKPHLFSGEFVVFHHVTTNETTGATQTCLAVDSYSTTGQKNVGESVWRTEVLRLRLRLRLRDRFKERGRGRERDRKKGNERKKEREE